MTIHNSPRCRMTTTNETKPLAVWTRPDGSVMDFGGIAAVRDVESGEIIAKVNAFTANGDAIPARIAVAYLLAAAPDLLTALRRLHDDTVDYVVLNNLGDPYANKAMRDARDAIALARISP